MSIIYSSLSQPYILAAFIYAGIIVGVLYSLFRIPRRLIANKAAAVVSDLLFVAAASAVTVFVLYKAADIVLRGYYLIGLGIGFLLYMAAILPVVRYIKCKFKMKKVDK